MRTATSALMGVCALLLGLYPLALHAQLRSDWGTGSFTHSLEPGERSLPGALGLPELIEADGDVFRFSAAPARGGDGYVITLRETPGGAGRIEAIKVFGHGRVGGEWLR